MIGIVILSVILLPVVYVLFAPLYIEINSVDLLFGIRLHKFASADLCQNNSSLMLQIKVAWWKKHYDLLNDKSLKRIPDLNTPTVNKRTKKQSINQWPRIKKLLRSFKLKKCCIQIDTGDMQLNGILYPAFYLISMRLQKQVAINFNGSNTIDIQLKNSLARILWYQLR